jgi:nucleoid DNA-binding protein
MATITKRDIVNHVLNKLENPTRDQVTAAVQSTIDFITSSLAKGNDVALRNFGTFEVRVTPQKLGRNPKQAGSEVIIPARAVVRFKPGKEMKERVAQVLPKLQARKKKARK